MTAKEYLSQVKQLNQRIKQNLDEEAELRAQAETIGSFDYSRDKVQTSPSNEAPYAVIIGRISDLHEEISEETDRLVLLRRRITREIQSMDNTVYSDLLYRRYIKYQHLDRIAEDMGYEFTYLRHLHTLALEEFGTMMNLDAD